ncbi:hypothetical protein SAMN05421504_11182 [Amycolatopsis xylanica]|uniref:Uncharacterized protein n=1 Tax=Amycolatopsis xylanica TaxID=589385 RepID=A0A1H3RGR5_9PSEU|nr:hypothetical protein [Amycolatopsis xylanica]SDZ24934.1 hypothetical protein SAMN05421504_11182 [Amycolatopsis xylanica]
MTKRQAQDSVAGFDSATAMVRALAAALRGERFTTLGQPKVAEAPLRLSRWLPEAARTGIYRIAGAAEGAKPEELGELDLAEVAEWLAGHYDGHDRYPGVLIGSSNGAAVHLGAVAGVPWLPNTVLVPVKWPDNDPDRPRAAMEFGRDTATALLHNNPDLALHHMHDGNQDRLMISAMSYFRLKWLELPAAYQRFLSERLAPGAPIVLLDCTLRWPVTKVAERHYFQTGAYGGLEPYEYLRGSPQVERFLAEQGSELTAFDAPEADDTAPEAEWGLSPEFGAAVERWAAEHGHPVHRLAFEDPQDLSGPVADLHREWLTGEGVHTTRLLVESFVLLDPVGAARAGLVPYWTPFPVRRARDRLAEYLRDRPFTELEVLLFPHGVRSAGIAEPEDWLALAERVNFPATDRKTYPADFRALAEYGSAIGRMADRDITLKSSIEAVIEGLGI